MKYLFTVAVLMMTATQGCTIATMGNFYIPDSPEGRYRLVEIETRDMGRDLVQLYAMQGLDHDLYDFATGLIAQIDAQVPINVVALRKFSNSLKWRQFWVGFFTGALYETPSHRVLKRAARRARRIIKLIDLGVRVPHGNIPTNPEGRSE